MSPIRQYTIANNGKEQKKDPNTVDPQHIYVKLLYIYNNFIQIIDAYIW